MSRKGGYLKSGKDLIGRDLAKKGIQKKNWKGGAPASSLRLKKSEQKGTQKKGIPKMG